MRKAAKPQGDPAGKADDPARAVDEYLATVPEPARTTLAKVRATIRAVVPREATEQLSYGMPAFFDKGALVGYAAFKSHCSFFPMNASLIDAMKVELKDWRTSKGTLQFSPDSPLPVTLLRKMVKIRVAENETRRSAKAPASPKRSAGKPAAR